jgi:putative hydrolase of the HAD superfamily
MTIKAAMFDFSGTLFRAESCERWLRAVLAAEGITATDAETATYARRLNDSGALPGGAWPQVIPPHLERICAERDLGAAQHRAAYTGLSRTTGLPWDIHDALYDRHMTPDAWDPYRDAAQVLAELRERSVPVAVVSNIGWDLRPVFRAHGLAELVDAFVLSYEVGAKKPDPRIFGAACDLLGVPPEDTLMVGDDRRADTGAAALGCPVHLVDHLPMADRPDALLAVLGLLA